MIEHAQDALTLSGKIKEALYSFAMFGMTQQTVVDMKAIATMVIVGALSAFGGSFLTARDNAMELKQYAKAQEEFRTEMRLYMRESSTEIRSLADRLTRQEILSSALHPAQSSASGMNGGVRK